MSVSSVGELTQLAEFYSKEKVTLHVLHYLTTAKYYAVLPELYKMSRFGGLHFVRDFPQQDNSSLLGENDDRIPGLGLLQIFYSRAVGNKRFHVSNNI